MGSRQGHSVEMVLPSQSLSIDEEPSPQIQTFPAYDVKDPPNAWKHLVLLATSMVLVFSTWFSATAALPQLKDRWDLSQNQASFLTIAVQLGYVVSALSLAGSGVPDAVNPRKMMGVGAALTAAANILFLAVAAYPWAVACRALTGAAIASVYAPGLKAASTWYRQGRGFALGTMIGALTLGSSLPHLVLALGGLKYQYVMVATSCMALVGAMCAFLAGDGPHEYPRSPFSLRMLPRVCRETGVMCAITAHCAHAFSLYGMWSFIQPFYASVFGNSTTASYLAFAMIAAGAPACIAGGMLADRFGRVPVASAVTVVSAVCTVLIGFSRGTPGLCLAIGIVWGIAVISDSALYSALVSEVAVDKAVVGCSLTLQTGLSYSVTALAIYIETVAMESLSLTYAFDPLVGGDAVVLVVLSLLSLWMKKGLHETPAQNLTPVDATSVPSAPNLDKA